MTDTSSHQESQAFYFVVPAECGHDALQRELADDDAAGPGRGRHADHRQPGRGGGCRLRRAGQQDPPAELQPVRPGDLVDLQRLTANAQPIIVVHHTLDVRLSVPTKVDATLTFNSVAGTKWVYNTSPFIAGDIQQIALQANATGLSTGRYSYSVQVVDERSTNSTATYT